MSISEEQEPNKTKEISASLDRKGTQSNENNRNVTDSKESDQ